MSGPIGTLSGHTSVDPDHDHLAYRLKELLPRLSFPGLRFETSWEMTLEGSLRSSRHFLRVVAPEGSPLATHTHTNASFPWNGRKWRLSKHMTDGEIIQTAFKAILTALEHEARERFTYKGVSVFDPHYDIEALVALRAAPGGSLQERN